MPLTEASVKIGKHGECDDSADMDIPVWAGVLPYRTVVGPLETVPEQEGLIGKAWLPTSLWWTLVSELAHDRVVSKG